MPDETDGPSEAQPEGAPSEAAPLPPGGPQAARPSRRRPALSDDERKAIWHRAVMAKARKLKTLSDSLTFACLAVVAGAMFLPLVGGMGLKDAPGTIRRRTGLELAIGLLTPSDVEGAILGTHPYIAKDEAGRPVELVDEEPADPVALVFLLVPAGAALLLLLYLLDCRVFMGRLLPALAILYGFGMTAYLMLTKTLAGGVWNALGLPSQATLPTVGWYMLLVPLFLLGAVSVLRLVVSQRWKRYEFAGLPVPERLRPKERARDATAERPGRPRGRARPGRGALGRDAIRRKAAGEGGPDEPDAG